MKQADASENLNAQVLAALKAATEKLKAVEQARFEPLAITGISMRFPGADDLDSYWRLLSEAVDAITEVPEERWDIDALYDPEPSAKGKITSRFGGFIKGVTGFDEKFFSLSPREVHNLDPQQRILLQLCWQALEHAGINPESLQGSQTGVYVGVTSQDYSDLLRRENGLEGIETHFLSGNTLNAIAGRLSYNFGFCGPSMVVDTACSSSLTAVSLACQSLRSKECDLAIVAGSNLLLAPDASVATSRTGMLAPDGRCKTFSKQADGYVRGEGCAVIVLKRLSDAEKDNDNVLALIRGIAINQDGPSGGLTIPSGPAQQKLMRKALANANVKAEAVDYIEAHGTGTHLGDPIEVQAVGEVYCETRSDDKPLWMGSVKTNIGHLEACAGLAGLIKMVLSIQHRQIPPHLHLTELNPLIPWSDYALSIPVENTPWPGTDTGLIGAVSSFGASGSNAHVILQGYEDSEKKQVESANESHKEEKYWLLPLSAKSEKSLYSLIQAYIDFLQNHIDLACSDICLTAAQSRAHFQKRVAVVGSNVRELINALTSLEQNVQANPSEISAGNWQEINALAERYRKGKNIDWKQVYANLTWQKVVLPTYIFDERDFPLPVFDTRVVNKQADKVMPENTRLKDASNSLFYQVQWINKSSALVDFASTSFLLNRLNSEAAACDAELIRYIAEVSKIENLTIQYILKAVDDLCEVSESNAELQIPVLADDKKAYFERLLIILEKSAYLISANKRRMLTESGRQAFAQYPDLIDGIKPDDYPLTQLELAILQRCGENISRVIKNQADSLDLLFPADQNNSAVHLYRDSRSTQTTNGLMATAIKELLTRIPENQQLRIIEIGAGTGGTTSQILPLLKGRNVHYTFTDISPHFLDKAREKFGQNSYFKTQLLNVEQSPEAQGFESGTYDIVLSTNAIHAAQDISDALNCIYTLTAPGGIFLLQEGIYPLRFVDLIFGMTEGWWRFKDKSLRPDHPLLSAKQWLDCLKDSGFEHTQALANDDEKSLFSKQGIFLASKSKSQSDCHPNVNDARPDTLWCVVGEESALTIEIQKQIQLKGQEFSIADTETLALALKKSDSDKNINIIFADALAGQDPVAWIDNCLTCIKSTSQTGLNAQIYFLTRGVAVIEKSNSNINRNTLSQSPLWGIGKTLALELPDLWGGLLDLDPAIDDQAEQAKQLVDLISYDKTHDFIAFRNKNSYVARLQKQPAISKNTVSIDNKASYLITGGLGGLGLITAQRLAQRGAGELILIGRSALSEHQKEQLETIKSLGAKVRIEQADVSNAEDVERVFLTIAQESLPLKGVIHAAGTLADGVLLQQSMDKFNKVIGPKIRGAWYLHENTKDKELDFFVLYSSTASLLGSAGQANHAAVNAYMDSLIDYRLQRGLVGLSIQWGPWADVGAAAGQKVDSEIESRGLHRFSPDEGIKAFEDVLGMSSQIGIVNIDWKKFSSKVFGSFFDNVRETTETSGKTIKNIVKELESLPPGLRLSRIEKHLALLLEKILRVDEKESIDLDLGFFELGMDSLMSLELKKLLQQDWDIRLSATLTFDFPTPRALAKHLCEPYIQDKVSNKDNQEETLADTKIKNEQHNAEVKNLQNDDENEIIEEDFDELTEEEMNKLIDKELELLEDTEQGSNH